MVIKERPSKHSSHMVDVMAQEGKLIGPCADMIAQRNVPFEAIVVHPPNIIVFALAHFGSVEIKRALVEEARKKNMRGRRRLRRSQIEIRSIPEIAERALAIGTANALRLNVKVGSHDLPLVRRIALAAFKAVIRVVCLPEA